MKTISSKEISGMNLEMKSFMEMKLYKANTPSNFL